MSGPVHQPGVCNIEAWDGKTWCGGMNRTTETEAIETARRWAGDHGRRYRAFDIEGRVIFDSEEQTGALAVLRDMKVRHGRGQQLPPIGPVIDAVDALLSVAVEMNQLAKGPAGGVSQAQKRAVVERMDAAIVRMQSDADVQAFLQGRA